ncbi:ABC transporter substrate-binding protein [Bordetella hinzii]|uniref:Transporter n=1 Tax=Bordetella hinzii TaxID=103855 RepID=A0AAN1RVY3_9BORD|nr:ABC transporter substrate-binding protein [Bordetella hinzii]AKQ57588.1 Heme-binding protein A precursor [Bordetella hinzii]AKQ62054.1 Heme-binding protein A precursor [Bordetella hinzii]AZW17028.1 transporter [Bordetella hinzii]KCB28871.1 ABC transporter, substrate-binding protein, family 5 [Bordetella hinzii L60]KCB31969.1 ABC transporter, substrate-binding protein, family 5 [Bordetella hinzii CA90 BAL1384]
MKSRLLATALTAGLLAAPGGAALAQTLKIALSSEPTSADPHYHKQTQNDAFSAHVYDSLVGRDANMKLKPALATSWKNLDDLTWEFKLRDDVKFSNGKPFTSEDVLFTICRTLNNETNISQSYMDMTKRIADVQTPDAHTVIIKTAEPLPLLPAELARGLPIIWNGIVEHGKLSFDPKAGCGVTGKWPTVADFNNGKDAIGTGPYLLKSYVKGTGIELTRNDNYWGEKPAWKEVKFVPVPNAGPRLTGLLSGDFDVIENPAARDLQRIKNNPQYGYVATPSTRLVFFQPDVGRSTSPFVKAADGKNPLQDLRVRRAISMAIDRKTIVARIMDGLATPAYQYMPDGMFGGLPNAPEIKYDPEGAKKLLAEAGYPNGFEMTISTTNDRYVNDGQIAQAVAQYLSRVGIKANVDAMTASIYFPKRAKREFSFSIGGWPSEVGEASGLFQLWVASLDSPKSLGTSNYGGFSNADFDKVYLQAIVTVDPAKREKLLQQSTQIALDNVPLIPLHFESSIWAFRKGLVYEGRRDQYTLAMSVKPADKK